MENTIENWQLELNNVLIGIANGYINSSVRIMNEVMIGDLINDRFPCDFDQPCNIMIWPEATWFKKNQESGFFVDRTIMDETKTSFSLNDPKFPEKNLIIEKYNKQFFHDDKAIAIELKHLRVNNLQYEEVLKDYKKLLIIQDAMDHRFKKGLYTILNSKVWRGYLVCGCENEVIYAEIKHRLELLIQSIPPTPEIKVFLFSPKHKEFLC